MTDTNAGGSSPPIPLIQPVIDSTAPVIFADYLAHGSVINQVVRLSFAQNLGEPLDAATVKVRSGWQARYCATIALPLANLENTVKYLTGILESYRNSGILPPPTAADGD